MIYVLYHANCFDGHSAAWVAWLHFGDSAKYIGCHHGNPPPELELKITDSVYILDFSFKREILLDLQSKVFMLKVIDHHKTAKEDLEGLDFCVFDMTKSGALLAWEHFNPNRPAPRLIQYVSDRDLWRFELPRSKEVHAYIASMPRTFDNWNVLAWHLENNYEMCVQTGIALLQNHEVIVESLCKHNVQFEKFKMGDEEITLPVINCPKQFSSDACVKLYETHNTPAAVYWIMESNMIIYGIRSRPDFDCSVIAKSYQGGGHRNAAGWQVAL
jgi:oligoribonuclease NrnB/cAMP/cGMP phosphodiesterase (DHH superfamily)